jgi:DNA-binding NarL/FixJ family response regulator
MLSLRILVVDDYTPFRDFLCLWLRREAPVVIVEATDGREAIEKADAFQPDVVLLDIGLPNVNGIEAARRIRTVAPHAKLLFVSQESSTDVVRRAFDSGADGYVHKIRTASDLMPAIEAVLAGREFVSSSLEFSTRADRAPVSHRHEMLCCADDGAMIEGLTNFVVRTLQAANSALVFSTTAHRDCLFERLRAQRFDVDAALRRGTLLTWDADDAPEPVRWSEAITSLGDAARKAGAARPRVAMWGERAGRAWARGNIEEAIRLEQFGSEMARSSPIDILCPYLVPCGQDTDPTFTRICEEHTACV